MASRQDDNLVLVSWIAVNNDPYERPHDRYDRAKPGPTLALLFDDESPYRSKIRDFVLFYRTYPADEDYRKHQRALEDTIREVEEKSAKKIRVDKRSWKHADPTDHRAIFRFLKQEMDSVRRKFPGRKLVIHVSPGTPSMQTIWILMGETGYIEPPFELVKSYRARDRRPGRDPVVKVEVGLETFYKHYVSARPAARLQDDQYILWDPKEFKSEKMKSLFLEARRFARLKIPVLILGERGTGKTTLASWIRANSPFRREELDKGWPAVPCGQYTPELMRAELFGYKKGAFSGAVSDHDGLLLKADGDTLFLDEIGDLSRDVQRLLIKAVEEGKYHQLGSTEVKKSRFRLLSATNIDMGTLRERLDLDFLDRIAPLTLHLPPLREIREELPWLWRTVYREACNRAGATDSEALSDKIHDAVAEGLRRHPLPGNLRDLFRVAYRMASARGGPDPVRNEKALIDYGLQALEVLREPTMNTALARALADRTPLDPVTDQFGKLKIDDFLTYTKKYIAEEVSSLHKRSGRDIQDLCDIKDRTLRSWKSR